MTYEWGYTYGPPMAVAPIPNIRAVLNYAVTQIARNKIYMGMPNYGYDWPLPYIRGTTRAQSISNVEAVRLAREYNAEILYDETAQSPHFQYTNTSGELHEVWFEDARSIRAKLALVTEFGFLGIGYWNLMRPFPQNWLVLNALYRIRAFQG
jgi:spore germination protein